MTPLQAEIADLFAFGAFHNAGPAHTYNSKICSITGRSPTVIESMSDGECSAVLVMLKGDAERRDKLREMAAKKRRRALQNELLRKSGRYGWLMADDDE